MGCSVGRGYRSAMARWNSGGGGSKDEPDARTKLERKLYLARESPEPEFDLSGCGLGHVPSGIYSICRVLRKEKLFLHNNRLKSLAGGGVIADLHLLTVLNVSHNKIAKLSDELRFLVSLRELNLSNNVLTELPDCVGSLSNLRSLDVSHNSLKELPESLGGLKILRILNISDNPDLINLSLHLSGAKNITTIILDAEKFLYPPAQIVREGTAAIMMFLCEQAGVTYELPTETLEELTPLHSPRYLEQTFQKELQSEWEDREASEIVEKKLHLAAKIQREKILTEILKEQCELDTEISKIHNEREAERLKLIREIQEEESSVAAIVEKLMSVEEKRPHILQQHLEHERAEHDRLVALCQDNYHSLRTTDVLRAMESMLEEQVAAQLALREYENNLGDLKRSTLLQELDLSDRLDHALKLKDATHSSLVDQLLRDENVQKAAVASLLERVDARSWSLKQEISIVASNLAKLSAIEQEKRRLEVNYNYDRLLHQRLQLLELLDDLLEQQTRRRGQLVQTLKDMENNTDLSTDFWLVNYQRLMDAAPKTLLNASRTLDPILANYLLQEGVIHCLPFLVNLIFSGLLSELTEEKLKVCGVNLTADRESIMRAVKKYLEEKTKEKDVKNCSVERVRPQQETNEPSAPTLDNILEDQEGIIKDLGIRISECAICMDSGSEVVFIPCGHLCCCSRCAYNQLVACPMCRASIEKKIRVIIS